MHNERYKSLSRQTMLPTFLSKINYNPQHDRIKSVQRERWINRFPRDPPSLLNSSFSSNRKGKYLELRWCRPGSLESKQKQYNASRGKDVTSQESFSSSNTQSSCLFDLRANHVTVKTKSVRSSNNLKRSSTIKRKIASSASIHDSLLSKHPVAKWNTLYIGLRSNPPSPCSPLFFTFCEEAKDIQFEYNLLLQVLQSWMF